MSYAEDMGLDTFDGDDLKRMQEELNEIEYISIPAWRMRDGNLIAIQDMDTSHIKNCIKMIYKSNGTWRHQYLKYFAKELTKRKFLKNPPIVVYVD